MTACQCRAREQWLVSPRSRPVEAIAGRHPASGQARGIGSIAGVWQVPTHSGQTPGRMTNGSSRQLLSFNRRTWLAAEVAPRIWTRR